MRYEASGHCGEVGHEVDGELTDPRGHRMARVSVRRLEGVAFDALPVQRFDGRSLP